MCTYTVNGERFADSTQCSIHGKTFAVPYIYNTKTTPLYEACIIKLIYSRENFCGALENRKNRESLAQQIFPRLR